MPSSPVPPPSPSEPQAPPADRKFPCQKCGARLDFDPSCRALKCPYCGHLEKIEPEKIDVVEMDYEQFLHDRAGATVKLEGRSSQVACAGCGAVVLLEDRVATERCPYCSAHLENKPESAREMIPPEALLPFAVDERTARDAVGVWLAGRWFAPSELVKIATLGRISGIYVPYWTYDSMTYTHYSGQRGDNYWETETYTETDAQGHQVTKTRQVMKTRWTHVSGEVQHFFDDVLICASKSMPSHLIRWLEPWPLKKVEAFKPDYLSGFQTERYAIGLKEGFGLARELMDADIRQLCNRAIGGDQQRLEVVRTQHVGVTFKHILLPVWVAAYRYRDDSFQVLINARTGAVTGDRPYSWVKIGLLIAAILALIGAIILIGTLVGRNSGKGGRSEGTPPTWRARTAEVFKTSAVSGRTQTAEVFKTSAVSGPARRTPRPWLTAALPLATAPPRSGRYCRRRWTRAGGRRG